MTLPAAYATISMGDINVELGRSRTAQISLDSAESDGYGAINTNSTSRPSTNRPAAMSEWYSYNHNAAPAVTYSYYGNAFYNNPCDGLLSLYYGTNGRWYRSDDQVTYTDMTGDYVTFYAYYDWGYDTYFYDLHYLGENNNVPQYWGGVTSPCAPY